MGRQKGQSSFLAVLESGWSELGSTAVVSGEGPSHYGGFPVSSEGKKSARTNAMTSPGGKDKLKLGRAASSLALL